MVIRISHKYISELLQLVKPHFPATLPIYGALHTINRLSAHTEPIWVDQWPKVGAILISPSSEQDNFPAKPNTNMLFAFTAEKASNILKDLNVFGDRKPIDFADAPHSLWKPIMDQAELQGFTTVMESEIADIYYIPTVNRLPARPALPAGFRLKPLQPEHAAFVNSVWPYSMGDITERYFEKIIKMCLAVGIFENHSETPIAVSVCNEQGAIGNGYVQPDYRRRGLASILFSCLMEAMWARGLTPYTSVSPRNLGSSKVVNSMGLIKTDQQFSWLMCSSK